MPATSVSSLTATGTPSRGSRSPASSRRSASAASASAASVRRCRKALRVPPLASMRASAAATVRDEVVRPSASSRAQSTSPAGTAGSVGRAGPGRSVGSAEDIATASSRPPEHRPRGPPRGSARAVLLESNEASGPAQAPRADRLPSPPPAKGGDEGDRGAGHPTGGTTATSRTSEVPGLRDYGRTWISPIPVPRPAQWAVD